MIVYVNTVTGIIDEVDGDSFLIDTDTLPDADLNDEDALEWESLDAEELVSLALNSDGVTLTEIPR